MSILISSPAFPALSHFMRISLAKETFDHYHFSCTGYYGTLLVKYYRSDAFSFIYTEADTRDALIVVNESGQQLHVFVFSDGTNNNILHLLRSASHRGLFSITVQPFHTITIPAGRSKCFFLFVTEANIITGLDASTLLVPQQFTIQRIHTPQVCGIITALATSRYSQGIQQALMQTKVQELLLILYHAHQAALTGFLNDHQLQQLRRAKQIIDESKEFDLDVNTIAAQVQMPPTVFTKSFTAAFYIAPLRYIRNRRLQKAKELLTQTSLPIKQIVFDLGFKNISNFYESYKRFFGTTPLHDRLQNRNQ